jgi:hypothetical protein
MRRFLTLFTFASATLLAPIAASANSQQSPKEAIDDLVTCTMIYSRTADLYEEQGKPEKSDEFQSTTYAYGVVADTVAQTAYGEDIASDYIDQRMMRIMEALNAESKQRDGGDLDVIAEWLDYCDAMGPRVRRVLQNTEY